MNDKRETDYISDIHEPAPLQQERPAFDWWGAFLRLIGLVAVWCVIGGIVGLILAILTKR